MPVGNISITNSNETFHSYALVDAQVSRRSGIYSALYKTNQFTERHVVNTVSTSSVIAKKYIAPINLCALAVNFICHDLLYANELSGCHTKFSLGLYLLLYRTTLSLIIAALRLSFILIACKM